MTSKKVLLYSGGMDSFIIDKLWKPDLKLYVDLKGIYNRTEIEHLPEDVEIAEFELYIAFKKFIFINASLQCSYFKIWGK